MAVTTVKQRCELLNSTETKVTNTRIKAFKQEVKIVLRNRRYAAIPATATPKYLS